jgi:TolB-like protein/class 3 adenylate cyclase/Tfp pilus assembly protein PilF
MVSEPRRRLAAVMFTDLVGYTAMMAESEAKALLARERHRTLVKEKITEFRGEWIEERGDEALATFESAVDAVRCALAIQGALREDPGLRLRIGIHLGDVVFDGGQVYGDGVNLASRIRAVAEPAGICISVDLYHAVRNQPGLRVRSLGLHRLKNAGAPLELFAVSSAVGAVAPRRAAWRWARLAAISLGALAALAAAYLLSRSLWTSTGSPQIRSLAVLPLENLSRNPEEEYFADGMTEALISDLAKIGPLRVISRTSVMQYKGARKPLPEITRELDVDAVVEGSVLRVGDRARISAQLIEAATDKHLWAESYERDLRDVLAMQSEIARAIAREVRVTLTAAEGARLASAPRVHPEAYESYLKGRYHWNRRTGESVRKGIAFFERAIEIDPSYAAAYAGLADSYAIVGSFSFGGLPPREAMPRAKAAGEKALEIDPHNAEAYTSLGAVSLWYEWDWSKAKQAYERAIELDPSLAQARQWLSDYWHAMGRLDEAIAEARRGLQIDPLSLILNAVLGAYYNDAGLYDEGIEQLKKALEIDPHFAFAREFLGVAYAEKARYEEAIAELDAAIEDSGGNPGAMAVLGWVHGLAGRREEALRTAEALMELSKRTYIHPTDLAMVYAGLGERDEAFRWLERAYEERSRFLIYLRTTGAFQDLHSDPRFRDLVRRVGLPE